MSAEGEQWQETTRNTCMPIDEVDVQVLGKRCAFLLHLLVARVPGGRANYLSQDRSGIQYAVNECVWGMVNPTDGDWGQLERVGRFVAGNPRITATYTWQALPHTLVVATAVRLCIVCVGASAKASWKPFPDT